MPEDRTRYWWVRGQSTNPARVSHLPSACRSRAFWGHCSFSSCSLSELRSYLLPWVWELPSTIPSAPKLLGLCVGAGAVRAPAARVHFQTQGRDPGRRGRSSRAQGLAVSMNSLLLTTSTQINPILRGGCPRERVCSKELKQYQSRAKCHWHVKRWQQLVRRVDCLNRTHSPKVLIATPVFQWLVCSGRTYQHGHTIWIKGMSPSLFQLVIQANCNCSYPRLIPSTLSGCPKFIKTVLEFPSWKTEKIHHTNKFIFETKHAKKMEGLLTDQGHAGMGPDGEDVAAFWWHLT